MGSRVECPLENTLGKQNWRKSGGASHAQKSHCNASRKQIPYCHHHYSTVFRDSTLRYQQMEITMRLVFNMDVGVSSFGSPKKSLRKLDIEVRGPVLVLYKVELHQCLEAQEIRVCVFFCFCVCVCLCFVACVWLHTFPSLLPSLHACMHTLHARIHYIMHTYITCTHTYTCIQIHAPDIQHIHRHTVHIYTYLHISIYSTSIYIHIHAYVYGS